MEDLQSTISGMSFDDIARNLGINPNIICQPGDAPSLAKPPPSSRYKLDLLSDAEWAQINASGILPDEPPQFGTLGNREILEAVITTVGHGRAWTFLDHCGVSSEAVRKKFSRLAAKGVWQRLAVADGLDLRAKTRASITRIGHRAQMTVRG